MSEERRRDRSMPATADRRTRSPLALAPLVERVTRPLLAGRSRAEASLQLDWPTIVGPLVADHARPEGLRFPRREERREATLRIVVDPAFALDLQHLEPVLIDRINAHFGFRLVARLQLRQGPVRRNGRPPRPEVRDLPAVRAALLPAIETTGIADPGLAAALDRLGRACRAGVPSPRKDTAGRRE